MRTPRRFARQGTWLAGALAALVIFAPVAAQTVQPTRSDLSPAVRSERPGGRCELGPRREIFVAEVVRAVPGKDPAKRDAEAFLFLPQTTFRQTVHQLVCVPKPHEILTDRWGNQIVHFVLGKPQAGQLLQAGWLARITVAAARIELDPNAAAPGDEAVAEAPQRYLADSEKYVLTSPAVRATADRLAASGADPQDVCRAIHEHLKKSLVYERIGGHDDAAKVLARGTGSCSERAFCWIALCRARGVPARYTGGLLCGRDFAFYDDAHHRWAEIFLPRYGWLPVDRCSDAFNAFTVGNGLLQLCWCGEGGPPIGWGYIGRTVDARLDKFICPAAQAGPFDRLAGWTERLFAAPSLDGQGPLLTQLEAEDSRGAIPVLQSFLYASDEAVVGRAARRIFALEPRAGAQLRSAMRSLPAAAEALHDALASHLDTFRGRRCYDEWVDLFNGRDLAGWTGEVQGFQVAGGMLAGRGRGGRIFAPYGTRRWYQIEIEFALNGTAPLTLILADDGEGQQLQIPFWTDKDRMRNRVVGAGNTKVGAYAARAQGSQTARVTVVDDELALALDGAQVLTLRNPAVAPGRIGIAAGRDATAARLIKLRVRELTRESAAQELLRAKAR